MEWQNTTFDWNRARAFLATAEEGSLSAAARALGLAQPTLGRQVSALEEELGVTLFDRVGNRLVLTATGAELAEQVRAMNDAAARVSLIAAGQSQALAGVVRVAASEAMAAFVLPPIVGRLREQHPGIEVELVVSNASSDLLRREADIAVRHARPEGDELVARQVRVRSEAHLYATPDYLERLGNPRTPAELGARATVLGYEDNERFKVGLRALGYPFPDAAFPVRTANQLVQWELAKLGLGVCMMIAEVGDHEPRVRRAAPDATQCFTFATWLTSHRELRTSQRMRVVFDALADGLAA